MWRRQPCRASHEDRGGADDEVEGEEVQQWAEYHYRGEEEGDEGEGSKLGDSAESMNSEFKIIAPQNIYLVLLIIIYSNHTLY